MNTRDYKQLKNLNLKQAVSDYAQGKVYFQITDLKRSLQAAKAPFSDESVRKYLYQLKKERHLSGAGRGWYSNLSQPFVLDTVPLQEISERLHRQFPLLSFCCWSTAQLRPFFHHLPGNSSFFVYADKDALGPVYDNLRQYKANCYLNPQKRQVQQSFRSSEDAIILRPAVSEEPKKGHHATVEKILVDLFIERIRLDLFDDWEYQHVFQAIVMHHRIDMASLIRYADRRKVKHKIQVLIH